MHCTWEAGRGGNCQRGARAPRRAATRLVNEFAVEAGLHIHREVRAVGGEMAQPRLRARLALLRALRVRQQLAQRGLILSRDELAR